MISGIIKVEVSVISGSRRLRLVKLTKTLIILDITKTESQKLNLRNPLRLLVMLQKTGNSQWP